MRSSASLNLRWYSAVNVRSATRSDSTARSRVSSSFTSDQTNRNTLREHLPRMGEYVAWGRALAEHLVAAGIQVFPSPPQTNTFELFGAGAIRPAADVRFQGDKAGRLACVSDGVDCGAAGRGVRSSCEC